jgi:hypothetical protein
VPGPPRRPRAAGGCGCVGRGLGTVKGRAAFVRRAEGVVAGRGKLPRLQPVKRAHPRPGRIVLQVDHVLGHHAGLELLRARHPPGEFVERPLVPAGLAIVGREHGRHLRRQRAVGSRPDHFLEDGPLHLPARGSAVRLRPREPDTDRRRQAFEERVVGGQQQVPGEDRACLARQKHQCGTALARDLHQRQGRSHACGVRPHAEREARRARDLRVRARQIVLAPCDGRAVGGIGRARTDLHQHGDGLHGCAPQAERHEERDGRPIAGRGHIEQRGLAPEYLLRGRGERGRLDHVVDRQGGEQPTGGALAGRLRQLQRDAAVHGLARHRVIKRRRIGQLERCRHTRRDDPGHRDRGVTSREVAPRLCHSWALEKVRSLREPGRRLNGGLPDLRDDQTGLRAERGADVADRPVQGHRSNAHGRHVLGVLVDHQGLTGRPGHRRAGVLHDARRDGRRQRPHRRRQAAGARCQEPQEQRCSHRPARSVALARVPRLAGPVDRAARPTPVGLNWNSQAGSSFHRAALPKVYRPSSRRTPCRYSRAHTLTTPACMSAGPAAAPELLKGDPATPPAGPAQHTNDRAISPADPSRPSRVDYSASALTFNTGATGSLLDQPAER